MFLSDVQLLLFLRNAAISYSRYADSDLLFVFRRSKSNIYESYGVHYGKRNFMHLAGIKSKTLNAVQFYQSCLEGKVKIEDCSPRHDIKTMHSKISILGNLLDLKHSKLYKIGNKNLVTKDNDFEMVTGNSEGIIGYDSRISNKACNEVNTKMLPIPTTLLTNPIWNYCSHPEKIMFILKKSPHENVYREIFYEIKKALFYEEYNKFAEYIKNMIDIKRPV